MINLMHGDCLELMKDIPDGSVDMVLTDPPYGITSCKWDSVIPIEEMWHRLFRIIKQNGVIVLFSKQPFTSLIISSALNMYKYSLVWKKDNHDNPCLAKKRFLNITEDINIFYYKQPSYFPQGTISCQKITKQGTNGGISMGQRNKEYLQTTTNYPKNILEFKRDNKRLHPTQKPVALLEYLIKTYTNENQTVLDFTMGSGSTGIACLNTNRKFLGIEKDDHYFNVAKKRIKEHQTALAMGAI